MGEKAAKKASLMTMELREDGYAAEFDIVGRGLKPQMRYADKIGAKFVCVLGDNELESGIVRIKNMRTGEETEASLDAFKTAFVSLIINETFETEGLEENLESLTEGLGLNNI